MLEKYNLCGYGGGKEDIAPDATVSGDCGSLTLELWNDPTPEWMHWQAIITSSKGAMVSASYTGNYHNYDTGGGHSVVGNAVPFSSYWQEDKPLLTSFPKNEVRILTIEERTNVRSGEPKCFNTRKHPA